jgi:hypothetical protein
MIGFDQAMTKNVSQIDPLTMTELILTKFLVRPASLARSKNYRMAAMCSLNESSPRMESS